MITLRVPATTANLGPGFDVLGLALQLYLSVKAKKSPGARELIYRGRGAESVALDETNLIWQTFTHVARREQVEAPDLLIEIENEIPIARGLGSSGAAVVAGVLLANEMCGLNLSQGQLLDHALEIEPHPDNITAAMVGGLVACCVTDEGHSLYAKIPISPDIKAVVVVPDFELATTTARAVLPAHYSRADAVFNLQRVAVLAAALGRARPELIAEAMRDRFHQPYRKDLIPGLEESLELRNIPGLLGVSLSGAGPSVLALAVDNFAEIGNRLQEIFKRHGIGSEVLTLDIEARGAEVKRET
jgi:homoserine kinase